MIGKGDPSQILDLVQGNTTEAELFRVAIVEAYSQGFRIVFLVGAGLAAFAFFVALFLMPQHDLDRPDDQDLKEKGRKAECPAEGGSENGRF